MTGEDKNMDNRENMYGSEADGMMNAEYDEAVSREKVMEENDMEENDMEENADENKNQRNNKRVLLLLIGLVILIGGAYLLYASLSDKVKNNQLMGQGSVPMENAAGGETPATENADSAEDENAASDTASADETAAEPEKYMAPDFTVYDAAGNAVKLSDFLGKPVILNFWASWCGPCKSEMPDFNTAYLQYGAKISFLMVDMTDGYSETQESGQEFIDEQGYVFPVYFDLQSEAAVTYGVSSIPTTYFIDEEGYFVAQGRGALDAETLQVGIDMLLEQE